MIAFAELLERLTFTPSRNGKIALLGRYFATRPDPDRGYGLAALLGTLDFPAAKPGMIRSLAAARTDPVLFAWSYDFVGDLAETVALLWPDHPSIASPSLTEVVRALGAEPSPARIGAWLDTMDASTRLALLKLVTGVLRVGASARLAILALAEWGKVAPAEVEEVWHGLEPPYEALFAWLERRGPRPDAQAALVFRPLMLSHPLEEADLPGLKAEDFLAEWKWDGIRVQVVAGPAGRRLYSRGAENISLAAPEILDKLDTTGVLDGELLVAKERKIFPFAALQKRLNRIKPTQKIIQEYPLIVRLFDMLWDGNEDLRSLPLTERRARLERWYQRTRPENMDLSPLIPFQTMAELQKLQEGARAAGIEGLMLKRADSAYVAGRPKGPWWKWKRAPLTIDAVLMYAERGHGKRSSFYSDYTFGVWGEEGELTPVGKAYSGYTDEELRFLDRWVRGHTVARFGPVREVEKALVMEVAFDAVQRSSRHKSGVALRFPRIARLRRDKRAEEADRLAALRGWIG